MSTNNDLLVTHCSELLQYMLEATPHAVAWKRSDLRYVGCNRQFAQIAGLRTMEEILGKTDMELYWRAQADRYQAADALVIDQALAHAMELDQPHPDGTLRRLRIRHFPLRDPEGAVSGIVLMIDDLTERRDLEYRQALQEAALEASADGLFVIDDAGRVLTYNHRFLEIWNISDDTSISGSDAFLPRLVEQLRDPDAFLASVAEFRAHPENDVATRFHFKDGRVIEGISRPLLHGDTPAGRVFSLRDMTEQVRATAALSESETKYRILIERMLDGAFTIEHERLTLVNSALTRMLGYTIEEMVGQPFAAFIAPTARAALSERHRLRQQGDGTQPEEYETQLLHKDGVTPIDVLIGVRVVHTDTSTITLGTIKDITERKRYEAQLRNEIEFSTIMIDSLPGIFYLIAPDGRLIRWNENYVQIFARPGAEVAGFPVIENIVPEDRAAVAAKIEEVFIHGTAAIEANCITNQGERVPYYMTGRRIMIDGIPHFLGTGVDISEQRRAEAERAQLREAIIEAQQLSLRELSTPLIPFSDDIVVMPLIGTVDSQRAQQVLDALLGGIASSRATVAILDITGVSIVDTQVANALIRAAQAVELLGAQVVLTGIRPEVAQTLVGLGVDLRGIVTRSSLQSGIAFALKHVA